IRTSVLSVNDGAACGVNRNLTSYGGQHQTSSAGVTMDLQRPLPPHPTEALPQAPAMSLTSTDLQRPLPPHPTEALPQAPAMSLTSTDLTDGSPMAPRHA